MDRCEYEYLQKRLSRKMHNNPYGRTGNFKREDGYKEGILVAKSILSEYYHMEGEHDDRDH